MHGLRVPSSLCQKNSAGWVLTRQSTRTAFSRRLLWFVRRAVHHQPTRGERMIFCRCCGKEIHETAPACPHCGGVQHSPATSHQHTTDGPLWVPITSLTLGIICVLALLDDSQWDKDTIFGLGSFSVAGLVLGAISLNKQKTGKGMAITGVVLSSIALLAFIGMFSK